MRIFIYFLILFGVFQYQNLSAQENAGQQTFDVIKNDTLQDVAINSTKKPKAIIKPQYGSVSIDYQATGVYYLTYVPDNDFLGEDYLVVEYDKGASFPEPAYIHMYLNVCKSIIYTHTDYANTSVNTPVVFYPLVNDQASHGPLQINGVTFFQNGTINSLPDNGIEFVPNQDFVGQAYLNYVAQDTVGNTKSGAIVIRVQDSIDVEEIATIKIATTNKNPATILLPLSGFQLDPALLPENGFISFIGPDVVEYTSNFGLANKDTFGLQIGSDYYRTVIVETIHIPEPNGFAIDDYVITTKETAVTFNVQANDVKPNLYISGYSNDPDLVQDTNDLSFFTYTPPVGFSGEKILSYTVYNGMTSETASIHIWVNNFEPQNNATYYLSTPKNTPLVINYDVPISNFMFEESASPIEGLLTIYNGLDTISVGCEDISGYNMVVYEPNNDFVGDDAFEISYCLNNGECELVKVFVNVQDIGLDSICLCVEDCVWVGDTDDDGKVSVADLLPIAYHQGEIGSQRDEAGASAQWFGQHAENWGMEQMYTDKDVKFVDANGDGLVAGDDLFEISNYYNQYHSLVSPNNLVVKDYPFELYTDQDTVYAGEHLQFQVIIGSEEYPVVHMNGLAYAVNIPPLLIDSSSLVVDFLNDSWFGNNAPSMEIAVQPIEGRIEAAFSRLSGLSTSGYGTVAVLDFIIEEDIEGINTESRVIPIDIHLDAMVARDGFGQEFTMPSYTKTIYLDLRKKEDNPFDPQVNITLYPNPAQQIINIHADQGEDILSVQIFNSNAALAQSVIVNYPTARIDVADLHEGIYFAQIKTAKGISVKKFVVQR